MATNREGSSSERRLNEEGVVFKHLKNDGRRGFDYEGQVAMLAALRCLQRRWPFHVATNATAFYPFDDVVVAFDDGNTCQLWALQLKNKKPGYKITMKELVYCDMTTKNKANKDFSLVHYCEQLNKNGEEKEEQIRQFCEDISLDYDRVVIRHALYTVRGISDEIRTDSVPSSSILNGKGNVIQFSPGSLVFSQVKDSLPEESMVNNFLDSFYLFYEQTDLTELLKKELAKYSPVLKSKTEDHYKKLFDEIMTWWHDPDKTLTQKHDLFRDFFTAAMGQVRLPEEAAMRFQGQCVQECRRQLGAAGRATLAPASEGAWPLHLALLLQAYGGAFPVCSDALRLHWDAVRAFWASGWCDTLVVRLRGANWCENDVRAFLEEHTDKKILLVGNLPDTPADVGKLEIEISFDQLESHWQQRIKSSTFLFQGHKLQVSELGDEFTTHLSAESILQLLQGKLISVGCTLASPVPYYITRRFKKEESSNDLSEMGLLQSAHRAVIVGNPGMGKTLVMTSLACEAKRATPRLWVVVINFRNYLQHLENGDTAEQILGSAARGDAPASALQEDLYEFYSRTSDWALFIDGFDEINPDYTEHSLELCSELNEKASEKGYLYVSTRPVCTKDLKQLTMEEVIMCPFSDIDLDKFFDYYEKSAPLNEHFPEVRNYCMTFLRSPENAFLRSLIEVPLQARMLFDSVSTVQQGEKQLVEKMTVCSLYSTFIEKTILRLMKEKQKLQWNDPLMAKLVKSSYDSYFSEHQTLSIYHIFPIEVLKTLASYNLNEVEKLLEDFAVSTEHVGIVVLVQNKRLTFLHQTFAEFLAATWLKQKKAPPEFIQSHYSQFHLRQTWTFFDLLFVGERRLHSAVIMGDAEGVRRLLEEGGDKNERDAGGRTPLHLAVIAMGRRDGKAVAIVELLQRAGCNPDIEDSVLQWTPRQYFEYFRNYGMVDAQSHHDISGELPHMLQGDLALHRAAQFGVVDAVKSLLAKGAGVCAQDEQRRTPLHWASGKGQTQCLRLLLKKAQKKDLDVENEDGRTAIDISANEECFSLLLQHGASGKWALHKAAQFGVVDAVASLLAEGAGVCAQDAWGRTPLYWASLKGQTQCLRLLLEKAQKEDLDVEDEYGNTAIDISANEECFSLLLQHGASGKWALHRAAQLGFVDAVASLLAKGNDVGAQDAWGSTPLHWASLKGQTQCLRLLLEKAQKEDLDVENQYGWTSIDYSSNEECLSLLLLHGASGKVALHRAARFGVVGVVTSLLAKGGDVAAQDEWAATPLHWASWKGQAQCLRLLLEKAQKEDLDVEDKYGNTAIDISANEECFSLLLQHGASGKRALHRAAQFGVVDAVASLLAKGADVCAQDKHMMTPLHWASDKGQTQCLRLLLEKAQKEDLDVENEYGNTAIDISANEECFSLLMQHGASGKRALHRAAQFGVVDAVASLLATGADVCAQDKQMMTPLHWASDEGQTQCLRLLLEKAQKEDLDVEDKYGITAIDISASEECFTILLQHGASGKWALHRAAQFGVVDAVASLLAKGADVGTKDKKRMTPMHWASYEGQTQCLRLLLEKAQKKDLDVENEYGNTAIDISANEECFSLLMQHGASGKWALHRAAQFGVDDTVASLLAAGADVGAQDVWGRTPLHWASLKGQTQCLRLLLEKAKKEDLDVKDIWGRTAIDYSANKECFSLFLQHGASGKWALHRAAQFGVVDAVASLLATGADVCAQDKQKMTPLHYASLKGQTQCLRLLLEKAQKEDLDVENEYGDTAIDISANEECSSLLLQHGASRKAAVMEECHFAEGTN